MGQVRWAGWTMAVATALVISSAQRVRADVESDKPAAIVVYPDVDVDTDSGRDTVVRLTNTNESDPILVHCFYVDANFHCSGGLNDGEICNDGPGVCTGLSFCVPGWLEVDFRVILTAKQPIEWKASEGLADRGVPIPFGVCQRNPLRACGSDADCNPFPGGACTQSNAGTRIPPVPEDPFVGVLQCIAIDANGNPVQRNDLKGEAISERSRSDAFTVSSYNAIGIQATGNTSTSPTNELVLGGPDAEYNGCPNYLILNHFFDEANNPVPGSDATIFTEVTLVPCTTDYLRQIPGAAVVQYLVFNEFEQRFSTSKSVRCFDETFLCRIGTTQCSNSIFNVNVAGTLTGQTRLQPIGSGLLGVAREYHFSRDLDGGLQSGLVDPGGNARNGVNLAAFNLHMQGTRETPPDAVGPDVIILP